MSSEANGITFINSSISNQNKTIPSEVILNLTSLQDKIKNKKIFISIEKNSSSNYILDCKKKFYRDTSTIVKYLAVVMSKQYPQEILHIFDAYYQEMARDIIQKDGVPCSEEEEELAQDLE